jgi:uncharacterized membrane protein
MRAQIIALLLLSAPCAAEGRYYADITVDIDAGGYATVSGTANHPQLSGRTTDSLTSKRGGYWLLNLTLPANDTFSEYVFAVNLPDGAQVNYAKATGQFRIAASGGRISVRGSGKDENFAVLVQYTLGKAAAEDPRGYASLLVPLAAAALIAAAALYAWRRGRKASEQASREPGYLTDRQRDILRLLRKEGKPVNQALVCERLGLPKSSVSRNVDSLAAMGLVRKTRNGMSTMLELGREGSA